MTPDFCYPVEWLRLGDLAIVFPECQRPLDDRKAKRIAENFDPDAFGVLTASLPIEGSVRQLIEGQHRRRALTHHLGWNDDQRVPCQIVPTTDRQRIAKIWHTMNSDRTRPAAIVRFMVAVEAGKKDEKRVHEIITGLGYRIGGGRRDRCFLATEAALQIYRRHGPDVLQRTILKLRNAWKGQPMEAVAAPMVLGMALFLASAGGKIDENRLCQRMSQECTAAELLGRARTKRNFDKGNIALNVRRVLSGIYNSGLRAGRVEVA